MRKIFSLASVLAVMTGLLVAASPASAATACPPGTTDTSYCEIVTLTVNVSPSVSETLDQMIRSGIPVTITCNSDCAISITVSIPAAQAQRLGIAREIVVGRGAKKLHHAGKTVVRVKLTKKARKGLAKMKKVRFRMTTKVKSSDGLSRTSHKTFTLKRSKSKK